MGRYLAWTSNILPESNIIIEAPDFATAKKILSLRIKSDTMFTEVRLMDLGTLETKSYFIEKV
jgi:uncharacterized protein YqfB (UPF0267 family)